MEAPVNSQYPKGASPRHRLLLGLLLCLELIPAITQASDWSACLKDQQAILIVSSQIESQDGPTSDSNNPQYVFPIRSALQQRGMSFLDEKATKEAVDRRQKGLLAIGETVAALEAAREMSATLLVKADITGQEIPIRGLSTSLQTIHGQIELSLLVVENGRILGTQGHTFRNAGMGAEAVLSTVLRREAPTLVEQLLAQSCAALEQANQTSKPDNTNMEREMAAPGGAAAPGNLSGQLEGL